MVHELKTLFRRDLEKLKAEIQAYPDDATIWRVSGEIKNPAGTLVLHLHGNLNHYIGKLLGNSSFVRDREAEFAKRDVPRSELIELIEDTMSTLDDIMLALQPADLERTYPLEVLGYPMTTGFFLIHLYGHLNWHLGQVNYHRRMR